MSLSPKVKMLGGTAVAVVALILVLPLFVNANAFLPEIESQLSTALGRPVTLGHISFSLFSGGLTATDLSIADDPAFSSQPFLKAPSLNVGVDVLPLLLHKQLNVREFKAVEPSIQLIQNAAGQWNFSTLGTNAARQAKQPSSTSSLKVDSLVISSAHLSIQTPPSGTARVVDKVEVAVKNFSFANAFPFTFSAALPAGGTLSLSGTAGPIDATDNTQTPLTADLTATGLDLDAAGLVDPRTGLGGVLDIAAHLTSDGKILQLAGTTTGNKMRFGPKAKPASAPVTLDFATAYTLTAMQGQLTKGAIKAGSVAAVVTGTYALKPAGTEVHLNLHAPGLSVDGVQSLLPAFGVTLPSGSGLKGGTLSVALQIDGPVNNLLIAGPVDLANSSLEGFNLASKLGSLSLLSTLTGSSGNVTAIQSLHTDIKMTAEQLATDNLSVVIPALGEASGNGVILPDGALNYRLQAKITALNRITALTGNLPGGLSALLGGSKTSGSNSGGIPLLVRGTTSNPSFSLDPGSIGSVGKGAVTSSAATGQVGKKILGLFSK